MIHEKAFARLREELKIDMLHLDELLIRLPSNQQEASELCAEAIQARDKMHNELAIAKASAAERMRIADPKRSAASITSEVDLDEMVVAAVADVEDAKLDAAKWSGLVDAFKQQGSSLKRLSELLIAGYLASNTAHVDRREELAEARKARLQDKAIAAELVKNSRPRLAERK